MCVCVREREGGREREREGKREREREGGRKGGREGEREGGREREGEREREREEREREGGKGRREGEGTFSSCGMLNKHMTLSTCRVALLGMSNCRDLVTEIVPCLFRQNWQVC